MLEKLELDDFLPYLNQPFRLQLGEDEPLLLELIEAGQLSSHSLPGDDPTRRRPFALVFRGPAGTHLPQQLLHLSHDQLGRLDLFLVPIQPDEYGPCYEAIFN